MASGVLASALVDDLSSAGFAKKIKEFTLEALDGGIIVELEQVDHIISVFENDVLVLEVSTTHEKFNEVLLEYLSSSLNF